MKLRARLTARLSPGLSRLASEGNMSSNGRVIPGRDADIIEDCREYPEPEVPLALLDTRCSDDEMRRSGTINKKDRSQRLYQLALMRNQSLALSRERSDRARRMMAQRGAPVCVRSRTILRQRLQQDTLNFYGTRESITRGELGDLLIRLKLTHGPLSDELSSGLCAALDPSESGEISLAVMLKFLYVYASPQYQSTAQSLRVVKSKPVTAGSVISINDIVTGGSCTDTVDSQSSGEDHVSGNGSDQESSGDLQLCALEQSGNCGVSPDRLSLTEAVALLHAASSSSMTYSRPAPQEEPRSRPQAQNVSEESIMLRISEMQEQFMLNQSNREQMRRREEEDVGMATFHPEITKYPDYLMDAQVPRRQVAESVAAVDEAADFYCMQSAQHYIDPEQREEMRRRLDELSRPPNPHVIDSDINYVPSLTHHETQEVDLYDVPGVPEQVQRMRMARAMREEKQRTLEMMGRPKMDAETMQRYRQPRPFSFMREDRAQGRQIIPLFVLQIDSHQGARVTIRRDTVPSEAAASAALRFKLNGEEERRLRHVITAQMRQWAMDNGEAGRNWVPAEASSTSDSTDSEYSDEYYYTYTYSDPEQDESLSQASSQEACTPVPRQTALPESLSVSSLQSHDTRMRDDDSEQRTDVTVPVAALASASIAQLYSDVDARD